MKSIQNLILKKSSPVLSLLSNSGNFTLVHKFGIASNKFFYSSNSKLSPAASYDNFEHDKARILNENKDKSGVYRLTNLGGGDKFAYDVSYSNSGTQKLVIYKENKNKCGVYMWINKITGARYVGSALDLSRRFMCYYSFKSLTSRVSKSNSVIYRALLKYGHSNFSLEILEYCDKAEVIKREQYYLDSLKPEYNILTTAYS